MNPIAGMLMTFEILESVPRTIPITRIFPTYLTLCDSTETSSWEFFVRIDLAGAGQARVDFLKIDADGEYEFETSYRQMNGLAEFFRRSSSYSNCAPAEFYQKIAELRAVLDDIPKGEN